MNKNMNTTIDKKIRGRKSLIGTIWYFSTHKPDFEALEKLGFRVRGETCEATVMSGAVARAEAAGFEVEWS